MVYFLQGKKKTTSQIEKLSVKPFEILKSGMRKHLPKESAM